MSEEIKIYQVKSCFYRVTSLAMRQIITGGANEHQTAAIFYGKLILEYNSLKHEKKNPKTPLVN